MVGVKTTGVFCISVCRARKPRRENVEFYNDFKSALDAGFGYAKSVLKPENARTAPDFVEQALRLLREAPKVRLSDSELRQHDISPERVRRWFLQNHGITFQAFQRMQRLNTAQRFGIKARPLSCHQMSLSIAVYEVLKRLRLYLQVILVFAAQARNAGLV